jgi:RNA polymerase sigma factor (TIGR02999 family)
MPAPMGDITRLLQEWRAGSRKAENELFELVFPNLRRLAHYFMKGEKPGHPLQATELVSQAYLRLVAAKDRDWQCRQQFFAIAGRVMRRYLIDLQRQQRGHSSVPLDNIVELLPAISVKLDLAIIVDQLLEELEKVNPDGCRLAEVKYFLGLTDEEAADALHMKLRTMQRKWSDVREWLFERVESLNARAATAQQSR